MKEFFKLVDQAVEINRARRDEMFKRIGVAMFKSHFAAEFCTVRINLGRGVGKTSYIKARARPWDVVIVANESMRRNIAQVGLSPAARVMTIDQVCNSDLFRGRTEVIPRNIYIDDASSFYGRNRYEIYERFARHPDQTFILLG